MVGHGFDDQRDETRLPLKSDGDIFVQHRATGEFGLLQRRPNGRAQILAQNIEEIEARGPCRGLKVGAHIPTGESNDQMVAIHNNMGRRVLLHKTARITVDAFRRA
jgi:hypothetical protein